MPERKQQRRDKTERFRDAVVASVFSIQRYVCESIASDLSRSPEMRNLLESTGASEALVRQRALANQESIYSTTSVARWASLKALTTLVVAGVITGIVLIPVGSLLWKWITILVGAALSDTDSVANHLQLPEALAASGLQKPDLFVTLTCVGACLFMALRRVPRRIRTSLLGWGEWRRALVVQMRERMIDAYQEASNLSDEQLLRLRIAPGLAGEGLERLLPRAELKRVRALAFDLGAGAIAVSGARGVGKTTLLTMLATHEPDSGTRRALVVNVAAPVRYDAREFLLHLYGALATAVLDEVDVQTGRAWLLRVRAFVQRLTANVVWAALFLSVCAALFEALPVWFERHGIPVPDRPAVYYILGLTLYLVYRRLRTSRRVRDSEIAALAQREQERTRFLRTFTMERQGAFTKAGLQVGARRSRQLSEQPVTLPELVASYRQFATNVAQWWRTRHSSDGKLLIGIDEIDRIVDAEVAEQFLNEMKSIFGVQHCVYIVSVSEEALANFERRVVRVRTAFDSAFDEIVRLEPMTVAESVELLRRRLPGVPDSFLLLCHCLAGGMPRDVVRTARTMLDVHRGHPGPSTLAGIARDLIAHEVAAIRRGFFAPGAHHTVDSVLLAQSLTDEGWPGATADALSAASTDLLSDSGDSAQNESRTMLAAALLFYATVLYAFTEQAALVQEWTVSVRRPPVLVESPETMRLIAVLKSPDAVELIAILEIEDDLGPAGSPDRSGTPDIVALGKAHIALNTHPRSAVAVLRAIRTGLDRRESN